MRLLVELLAPEEGMRIWDPTCGSGDDTDWLRPLGRGSRRQPAEPLAVWSGKNYATWAIGKLNMLLHALPDSIIEKGDTIRGPRLLGGGRLMLSGRVIANPPFFAHGLS